MQIIFEWDEQKAQLNLKKHGVSFEMAAHVFADPFCYTAQDRFENGEYRWQTIGKIANEVVILVAHVQHYEENCEIVRIISARKATKQERLRYGKC